MSERVVGLKFKRKAKISNGSLMASIAVKSKVGRRGPKSKKGY